MHGLEEDLENILAAMTKLFAQEGNAREVAILANSKVRVEQTQSDNWNGGTYGYTVHLELPAHLFSALADNHEKIEKLFCNRIKSFNRRYENEYVHAFVISTEVVNDEGWRDRAKTWLTGKGVTNQGRARSDNVAPLIADGLLFRSNPEIHFYRALKTSGVSFAPLPVFVRGGATYRRLEPDFVILKDGIVLIVEVDGDTVHVESPREASDRLTMLRHEGAHIERVNAADCNTPEKATACVQMILSIIDKLKKNM